MHAVLEIHDLRKSFGNLIAVDKLSLRLERGHILALIGENGAGKTTAMRIAAGALAADSGSILVDGHGVSFSSPRDASRAGIEMVHQHFMLVPRFSIAENLALAATSLQRWIPPNDLLRRAEEIIERNGIALDDPSRLVADLSVGEKAKLELVKTLSRDPRVLILDEPTAVLTPPEVEEFSGVLRRLAAGGVAIIFITHKLAEVFGLADEVAVMRAGALVLETRATDTSPREISAAMVGRPWTPEKRTAAKRQAGEVLLECAGVTTPRAAHAQPLAGIDLRVDQGEIVAIVGVAGNGQHELAEVRRGLVAPATGEIRLRGRALGASELLEATMIGHVPPDRTNEGIVAELSVAENLALTAPRWLPRVAIAHAEAAIDRYRIKTPSPVERAGRLSGGNQQKVVLARALERAPELIVASEPTRGLDIDATGFVHEQLRAAAARGAGVVLITSDLDEAVALGDAIHVMYRGRLSERMASDAGAHRIGELMAGLV